MRTPPLILAAISALFLSGCISQSIKTFEPFQESNLNTLLKPGKYAQKTDTFLVINDSSSSMGETFTGSGFSNISKLSVEKELLNRMNKTIPNLILSSGLRSFGYGPCTSWEYSHLNQAIQIYSNNSFNDAINSLECSNGGTPAETALIAANTDLANINDNIAIILLSDGHQYSNAPIAAVAALKAQFADKLCVYTIWVGNEKDHEGQAVLAELSKASACGLSTTAAEIASNKGMADFVTKVFLKKAEPIDADQDGVLDCHDQCLNTPKGATVNEQGCWVIKGVHFDTNKSDIKSQYHGILNSVATIIDQNPALKIEIQGHTDNQGSATYNLNLSDQRAKSVRDYLSQHTQSQGTLTARGYGLTMPIDSNDTAAGRSNNRRVQLKILH